MNYLLDANTVSYYFKGVPSVVESLLNCKPAQIFLPAIVVYEIEYGILKSQNPQKKRAQFEHLLADSAVLDFSKKEATAAAEIRRALEAAGKPIGPYDVLIAATAMANGLTLVTHNTAEFKRVRGLRLADWAG